MTETEKALTDRTKTHRKRMIVRAVVRSLLSQCLHVAEVQVLLSA